MSKCEPLFDNHNRILSVMAKINEKHLADIIDLLTNDTDLLTKKVSRTISETEAAKIIEAVEEMKNINKRMFEELELKAQHLIDKRILISKVSYLWSVITDHSSKKLKNYGELTESQIEIVDDYIEQLITAVNKLQDLIS